MSEQQNQISVLTGALTTHQRHFGQMSTENRQWVIQNTEAAIGLFAAAVKNRTEVEVKKLLKFLRPILFPAIQKFVAAEKFREGKTVDDIKVGWLGSNFKTNFLKKVEKSIPALDIKEHELVAGSRDPAIITELGGKEQVETFLAHFWEFLKTADQTLVHVRYIHDVNSVLWAVSARWLSGGLRVEALSLVHPGEWDAGDRFLSR